METQADKFPHSMMWIAGIAITLFCVTGIAAIMGWIPTSMGRSDDSAVPAAVSAAKPGAAKSHAASQVGNGRGNQVATAIGAVGGVVAGNEIEKRMKTTRAYEINVRMEDGTSRTIRQAAAPAWRAGDRVKIVDGAIRVL